MMNPLPFGRTEVNLHPIQEQRFSQISQRPTMHGKNFWILCRTPYCCLFGVFLFFVCLFICLFLPRTFGYVCGFFCVYFQTRLRKKINTRILHLFLCIFPLLVNRKHPTFHLFLCVLGIPLISFWSAVSSLLQKVHFPLHYYGGELFVPSWAKSPIPKKVGKLCKM